VTVNGREAKATVSNFAEWQIELGRIHEDVAIHIDTII
jgi:hypothetical protein